ncbi:MAG: hypothetical protein ACR2MN_18230 [Acidimicrobiales bacterium]
MAAVAPAAVSAVRARRPALVPAVSAVPVALAVPVVSAVALAEGPVDPAPVAAVSPSAVAAVPVAVDAGDDVAATSKSSKHRS